MSSHYPPTWASAMRLTNVIIVFMAKSALSSFLIRKFQQTLRYLFCLAHSIYPLCIVVLMPLCLFVIATIFTANKSKRLPSPSYPRVIPSRGYRKLSRTKQPHPKGTNRKPHKTTLSERKQPKTEESERQCNHLSGTTNHLLHNVTAPQFSN